MIAALAPLVDMHVSSFTSSDMLVSTQWARAQTSTFPDKRAAMLGNLFDQLLGASERGFIRATPLSEDPQSAASSLKTRPERSTQKL
jgi:hypothetical protein